MEVDNSGELECEPLCQIDNCYQCASDNSSYGNDTMNGSCIACDFGYVLQEENTVCMYDDGNISDPDLNCQEYYGQYCDTCNDQHCLSCTNGSVYEENYKYCCE